MEEEKKEQSEKKNYQEKLLCDTEKIIEQILEDGIQLNNLDYLGKVVDIHKDICEEMYRKERLEIMRYNNYSNYSGYGNYGDDSYGNDSYGKRMRDSRGRYMNDSYGRRGRSRYRGHEYMGDMEDNYGRYMESHNRYGAGKESTESLEYMLQSAYDFMKHISEEAGSQEEMELVKEYADKISRI